MSHLIFFRFFHNFCFWNRGTRRQKAFGYFNWNCLLDNWLSCDSQWDTADNIHGINLPFARLFLCFLIPVGINFCKSTEHTQSHFLRKYSSQISSRCCQEGDNSSLGQNKQIFGFWRNELFSYINVESNLNIHRRCVQLWIIKDSLAIIKDFPCTASDWF